ncbi:MAG: hypothetical protein Q7V57_05370 [Actinomycetota bacterium]|nr:hypothetical protein [Actinomycetota bacterium]
MCRRVTCKKCGKPNWAGCGAHVETVLGGVPKADRCRCREGGQPARPAVKTAAKTSAAAASGASDASAIERFKEWLRR